MAMILYAGSYTEMITGDFGGHGDGIYCFNFDPRSGSLQLMHALSGKNPSYLCIPSTGYLYTHTEVIESDKPRSQAYKINKNDFSLQLMNEQEIPGGLPCYIKFSNKNNCILVACYQTGNTVIFPLAEDRKLLPHAKVIQHEGSSVNPLRQERAHAHMVAIDDNFNNILVVDLGMDKIMVYDIDEDNGKFVINLKQAVRVPPGSGPRHIAVHPATMLAYVINELTATVTVMRYADGNMEPMSTFQTLPKEFKEEPSGASIRVSENGKFIYISERGENCITVLRFDQENQTMAIVGREKTMGKTPRDINLDPTGNWLLAANQDSDSIAVFKIDKTTGMIMPEHLIENIKSPVCLEWLPVK